MIAEELNWPGPEVSEKRVPDYEWAFIKASLQQESNEVAAKTYEFMFEEKPRVGTPYWLVRLAIHYGALVIGHRRAKKTLSGMEREMYRVLRTLDLNALKSSKVLWKYMWLHDVEDEQFSGRDLVTEYQYSQRAE